VARVRAGQITERRVQLAAHFGLAEVVHLSPGLDGLPCPCDGRQGEGRQGHILTCYLCQGTGTRRPPTDLIPAVEALAEEIGDEVLTRWANESTARARKKIAQDSLETPQFTSPSVSGRATKAVTWAYRISGNSAEERAWQRRRLGELLVGL
jgi:hypothetical protein